MALQACDDNTSLMGIYPDSDKISYSTQPFDVTSTSWKMDSVIVHSTLSYLGNVTDPETGTEISADFITQFFTFENYTLPRRENMMGKIDGQEKTGVIQCDSIEVRLYYNNYYGLDNNPIKISAYELSHEHYPNEDSIYLTSHNLNQFLPIDAKPLVTKVVTPHDFTTGNTVTQNIRFKLDNALGTHIMQKYYENPQNYKNSYNFIRNVFPGLYFKVSNGSGTMFNIYVGTLNLYFHYKDTTKDTTYVGMACFSATPEVIQSTRIHNKGIEALLKEGVDYTYLKTPAGIATELTLPVDEIFKGTHATDSISLASITLNSYNSKENKLKLGAPKELLMVRKDHYTQFFHQRKTSDKRTSYTTSFNPTLNCYTFDNIGRLISYCKREKTESARKQGVTEEQWALANPNWNKVLLIPVITSSTKTKEGQTIQVSVNHDMNLNSIRLVGGTKKIKMQVVYSKFK